jgi:hypothetical protein
MLEIFFSLYQSQQYHYDGNNEEHVNESTHGGTGHETQYPQDDENDGDELEHTNSSAGCFLDIVAGLLHVTSRTTNGVATGGEKCNGCGGNKEWNEVFER